jgi:hypothetical protein
MEDNSNIEKINNINSLSKINNSKGVIIFRKNIIIEKNKNGEEKEKENILIYHDEQLVYSNSLKENKFNKNFIHKEKLISDFVNKIQKIENEKKLLEEIGLEMGKGKEMKIGILKGI